jgi:predicted nucleic acid-binding protein
VEVTTVNTTVRDWNLGAGESDVLNLAYVMTGYRAMIDDSAARDCAKVIGVPFIGTGGFLVLAKRRGFIGSASAALLAVMDAGLWLSDGVVDLLKKQAGE